MNAEFYQALEAMRQRQEANQQQYELNKAVALVQRLIRTQAP